MATKYKIGQKVNYFGKKCEIIATKTEPYKPTIDLLNRSSLYPEHDYLLFILETLEPLKFTGILDVIEGQIESDKWV
jgi:hypothetical protein